MSRQRLRDLVVWVIAADFPLLYLSAITPGSTTTTIATLAIMGAAAVTAALVY